MFLTRRLLQSKATTLFVSMCVAAMSSVTFAQSDFDELIIFGDSLSDTGNLASVTANFPFPFFENRISDGPVIVDYLATELGLSAEASRHTSTNNGGDNFAIAGGNILGNDTEDLSSQVSAYLSRENGAANPDALYFLMMGGNDLRDIRSVTDNATAQARINQVADQFMLQLMRLHDAGARTFLIANVANIGRIPETLERQANDPTIVGRAEAYVRAYNQLLSARLSGFKNNAGISLNEFDLFAELENLIDNAAALGFTETEKGCFRVDDFSFQPECLFGTRFDRFVFFDNIHPTGKSSQLAGAVLVTKIPLPNIAPDFNMASIAPIIQLLLLD